MKGSQLYAVCRTFTCMPKIQHMENTCPPHVRNDSQILIRNAFHSHRLFKFTPMPGDEVTTPTRKPRKDCRYNTAELDVLRPFKEEFRTRTTTKDRLAVLKNKILPAMFNYWQSIGKQPVNEDESRAWSKVRIKTDVCDFEH